MVYLLRGGYIMNNEVLKRILAKRAITINDRILFKTIFEVLSTLFTNEEGISTLKLVII